ncbi:MAG: LysR family transcriptional regulator [Bradymonadaceae bacterium]|nr:LysR family transcriptional regulator [Lujinxingiaceae bacterium]
MNLSSIDLNLLVALNALIDERSVTRAAARVGLSQSATSHALNRLRDIFSDPLLVRSGRGMILTPRAQSMVGPLAEALRRLEQVIEDPCPFVPESSEQTFVIAASDYAQFMLLPALLERLASVAPGVNLRVRELGQLTAAPRLESGEVDIALPLGLPEHVPETLYRRDLFQLDLVCMVRSDHPTVGATLDVAQYAALSHILISARGDDVGVVDITLAKLGLTRRVALVVPHFLIAPHVVACTDHVLTTAGSVARAFEGHLPIRLLAPPLELERGTVSLVWHPRTQSDPGHRWLRAQIVEVSESRL